MNCVAHLSLKQYYLSVRGLSTAVAAVALPFASKFVGADSSTYLFPPLGSMDGIARLGLVALCLGVTVLVYFLVAIKPIPKPPRPILIALSVGAICLIAYLAAYQRFVRRIDIPARETSVYVSVGYERTKFADQTFGPASEGDAAGTRYGRRGD